MAKDLPTYAVIDCETTIFQNGNPFSACNRLCLIGVRHGTINEIIPVEYDPTEPYADGLNLARNLIGAVDTVVLFNAKFDLNWLARYGIVLPEHVRVWDCQLAEFILGCQRPAYPSLDDCLAKHNLGSKLHNINDTYWSRGIDTPQIPLDELTEYLQRDLEQTDALYNAQLGCLSGNQRRLFDLQCRDLQILQEMEFNGQLFAWQSLREALGRTQKDLDELDLQIREYVPQAIRTTFNIDSGDHLSKLLYGGPLSIKVGTEYQRTYKSGPRAGETVTAYKWEVREYTFPQLVKPIEGTELKKDGFYSTDEATLLSLSKPKPLIKLLLKRAELAKLSQTYLSGIPKIAEKYDWQDGLIHGTFNQCRVITGRLSSEKPNQQNYPPELNEYIISRFH